MERLIVFIWLLVYCSAQQIQKIYIYHDGKPVQASALIDSASKTSFVTTSFLKRFLCISPSQVYVNEDQNFLAEEAVNGAVAYVNNNESFGISVNITRVITNRTESVELLQALCRTYASMLETSTPPHLVLDTTMTGLSSETVKSFTASLGLPTITASFGQERDLIKWRNIDDDEKKYMIQINPPNDIIPQVIKHIVKKQNITNAAVIFDSSFVMEHKYKSLFQNIATRNVITALNEAILSVQIQQLMALDLVNFFILGRIKTLNTILNYASEIDILKKKYAWHFITSDTANLTCNCKNWSQVLHVKPLVDSTEQEALIKLKNIYNMESIEEITSLFYFDFAVRSFLTVRSMLINGTWTRENSQYITCDDYTGNNTPRSLGFDLRSAFIEENKTRNMIGSFNMVSNGKSYMNFYMDMSIVRIRQNKIEKTTQVGTWQAGLDGNVTFSNEDLLSNFTSTQIYRVVVVEQPPFVYIAKLAPRGYRGYCIDMMDMIAEELGFDYEIQLATGNKMGDMDDYGRWDGMMKDLIDKKADIGLGSISVMAERESVIDFTVPYYDLVGYSILMKTSYVPPSIYKFLTVLEDDVWISIIVAYFITSFLLWAFDKYSPNSYQNNPGKYEDEDDKRIFTMKESLWFCMTSLTPQGGGEAPKQLSGRLVAATWWLFGFIIIASYTANLAAFLTVSRLEHTIESLDDLYKQYRVVYAPVNGSNAMIYFERMSNIEEKFYEIWKEMSLNDSLSNLERSKLAVWDYPISDKFSKIWQMMQDAGLPNSLTEAVAKVRASKSATQGFAFIADATDVKYQELISCDLVAVGDEFSRKPYALAVQQGSPLKNRLNGVILDLMNRRKLEALRKKWWENNPERMECPDPENPSEGISMRNIGGVFILIIIGIGMAIGILSLEYYLYHREKEIKIIGVRDIVDGTQMYTGSSGKTSLKRIE